MRPDARAARLVEEVGGHPGYVRLTRAHAALMGRELDDEAPTLILQLRPRAAVVLLVGTLAAPGPVRVAMRAISARGWSGTRGEIAPGEVLVRQQYPSPYPLLVDVALYGALDVERTSLQLVEETG